MCYFHYLIMDSTFCFPLFSHNYISVAYFLTEKQMPKCAHALFSIDQRYGCSIWGITISFRLYYAIVNVEYDL